MGFGYGRLMFTTQNHHWQEANGLTSRDHELIILNWVAVASNVKSSVISVCHEIFPDIGMFRGMRLCSPTDRIPTETLSILSHKETQSDLITKSSSRI